MVYCTEPTVTVGWVEPRVNDNSGEYTLSSNYKPGDRFPVDKTIMIQYDATDLAGNVASISFFVAVSGKIKGTSHDPIFQI